MSLVSAARPTSLLEGVEAAVCRVLRIPKLTHRSALLGFSARGDIPPGVVRAAFGQVEANWNACVTEASLAASRENWRWRVPQLGISEQNTSPEVVLERAIVNACERLGRTDWANQIPVASGVAGYSAERRRAIDLVHEAGPDHFEFIELKVASDTPLSAAVEIIGYLCIWLLSRKHNQASALLRATKVEAIVLAPDSYYARFSLKNIAARLDQELQGLGRSHEVSLSFKFQAFFDSLLSAPLTDEALTQLLDRRRSL